MRARDPRRALGAAGERLARAHLEARGLTVLDTNFRTRHGELDIVAADHRCLVFCEVKTRVARATGSDARAGELGLGAGELGAGAGELGAGAAERQAGAAERQAGAAERQAGAARRQAGAARRQAGAAERQAGAARREAGGSELGPFAAIGPRKQRKLRLLAREWLARHGAATPYRPELRFDAVGVEVDAAGRLLRIDHLEGAF